MCKKKEKKKERKMPQKNAQEKKPWKKKAHNSKPNAYDTKGKSRKMKEKHKIRGLSKKGRMCE